MLTRGRDILEGSAAAFGVAPLPTSFHDPGRLSRGIARTCLEEKLVFRPVVSSGEIYGAKKLLIDCLGLVGLLLTDSRKLFAESGCTKVRDIFAGFLVRRCVTVSGTSAVWEIASRAAGTSRVSSSVGCTGDESMTMGSSMEFFCTTGTKGPRKGSSAIFVGSRLLLTWRKARIVGELVIPDLLELGFVGVLGTSLEAAASLTQEGDRSPLIFRAGAAWLDGFDVTT